MAFGLRNANYNALKKLSLRRRLDALFDPPIGTALFEMLTPTQAASLFPKYWLEGHPDIGGFLKAIPSSVSAERQKQYEKQLENTATGAAAGENFDAGGYRREYQKNMNEQTASVDRGSAYNVPKFTAEQDAQWNKIMSGPTSADDVASFSKLSAEQLKTMNLTKYKDETTGKEMIRYTPPEITEEQAKASLNRPASQYNNLSGKSPTGYGGITVAQLREILTKEATARGINPDLAVKVFGHEGLGNYSSLSSGSRWNKKYEPSYGPLQLQIDNGLGRDFINDTGIDPSIDRSPKSVIKQIQYGLNRVVTHGWGAWSGAKSQGIIGKMGVGANAKTLPLTNDSFVPAGNAIPDYTSSRGGIPENKINYGTEQIDEQLSKGKGPGGSFTKDQIDQEIKRLREQQPGLSKQEAIRIMSQQTYESSGQQFAPGDQRGAPSPLGSTRGRSPDLENVDPRLREIMAAAASHLPPGYKVTVNEGYNPRGHTALSQHHIKGKAALDLLITDPNGNPISNRGNDPTGIYTLLARHAYGEMKARHPNLEGSFGWGGSFGVSRNDSTRDLMHFDLGTDRGRQTQYRLKNLGPVENVQYGVNKVNKELEMSSQEQKYSRESGNPFAAKKQTETPATKVTASVSFNEKPSADQRDVPGSLQSVTQPKGPENAQGPIKPKTEPVTQKTTPAEPVKASAQATPEPSKTTAASAPAAAPPVKSPAPAPTPSTASPSMMQDPKAKTLVPGKADGGPVAVNTEQIAAYPIDGLRSDNAVVVNAHQKPLFTMNTNEKVLMDPNNNRAQVIPENKKTDVGAGPQKDFTSGIREEFNSTINQIKKDFANLVPTQVEPPSRDYTQIKMIENGWLNAINQSSSDPLNVPSIRRVAYRAGGMETGDPSTGFHHSRGNNS